MMKGGGTQRFGVVLAQELEVLAIVKGGRGFAKSFILYQGGAKGFGPPIVPSCTHPALPVINYQSLTILEKDCWWFWRVNLLYI